ALGESALEDAERIAHRIPAPRLHRARLPRAGPALRLACMSPVRGFLPWLLVVAAATGVALALDAGRTGTGRSRAGQALGLVLLGAAASWAVMVPWRIAGATGAPGQVTAWWALVLPVFILGLLATGPSGPTATVRLAVLQAAPATLLGFAPASV